MRGYYFITDPGLSAAGLKSDCQKAVAAGVEIIQYRNKEASTRTLYDEALCMKNICMGTSTRLIINDRIDIALAVDADGVHIGQEDMPYHVARSLVGKDKIIGVTVHTLEEAKAAQGLGADYLGVSPIFTTATKLDAGKPCGVEVLKAIRQACNVPIVAIGGIDLSNIGLVIKAGADMACAISALVTKPDVRAEILKFQKEFGL
jgi:thiamine-phosphate pyrophosphorylase